MQFGGRLVTLAAKPVLRPRHALLALPDEPPQLTITNGSSHPRSGTARPRLSTAVPTTGTYPHGGAAATYRDLRELSRLAEDQLRPN